MACFYILGQFTTLLGNTRNLIWYKTIAYRWKEPNKIQFEKKIRKFNFTSVDL